MEVTVELVQLAYMDHVNLGNTSFLLDMWHRQIHFSTQISCFSIVGSDSDRLIVACFLKLTLSPFAAIPKTLVIPLSRRLPWITPSVIPATMMPIGVVFVQKQLSLRNVHVLMQRGLKTHMPYIRMIHMKLYHDSFSSFYILSNVHMLVKYFL